MQGFHWENSQATLHSFVSYFRSSNGDMKHKSICVIFDCLTHYQTVVFLTKVNNIKILDYYSHGAPSQ